MPQPPVAHPQRVVAELVQDRPHDACTGEDHLRALRLEAHHAAAATYRDVAAQYPHAMHLGLTATPERSDGAGLRDSFDALVVGATIRDLQADGYLADCDVLAPGARIRGGIAVTPAEAWRTYAGGRPTVVFCRSIEESQAFVAELGDVARHIDGRPPPRRPPFTGSAPAGLFG